MSPRIVFMGSPGFACAILGYLLEYSLNIACVVTRQDSPKGRGRTLHPTPVKEHAVSAGITVLEPVSLKDEEFLKTLKELEPDIFLVVAFRILPREVFQMPRLGTINLHASLLPKYRGAAPINWAIINGEKTTGLTTFLIDEGIDTGRILLQEEISIQENETAGELIECMVHPGSELIIRTMEGIVEGTLTPKPQPEGPASNAPKLKKSDGKINWNSPARVIHNLIRGVNPWPGAYCSLSEKILKVHRTHVLDETSIGKPGEVILASGKDGMHVQAGTGLLNLLAVQPQGKRSMTGAEWVRGYGITTGMILG